MDDEDGAVEELALRLLEKQERAAERRERILEEKRQQLLTHERERQRKIDHIKQLRALATDAFIRLAPQHFFALASAGLDYAKPLTPVLVEQILMADPRVCEHCDAEVCSVHKTCTVTGKPHRRSLIVVAEKLLKLIGDTRVNLVPSKSAQDDSNDAVPAVASKSKAKRGISVNPQLFVLAFFNCALDPQVDEVDPLLQQAATHLVHVTELLKAAVASQRGHEEDTMYVTQLLGTFAKAWLRYVKVADSTITLTSNEREASRQELIRSTSDMYVATWSRIQRAAGNTEDPETEQLMLFLGALEVRLRTVGGDDEVVRLREYLSRKPTAGDGPPSTPEKGQPKSEKSAAVCVVVPQLQLSQGTSGSETDRGEVDQRQQVSRPSFGPELPPLWYVDVDGISQPPKEGQAAAAAAVQRQQAARELRERLEFRALKAFEAKTQFNVSAPPPELVSTMEAIDDATLETLRSEINATPPKLERVPIILNNIVTMLVEALPKKLRSRIGQEVRDVLDWNMVRRAVRMNETNIAELFKYVVGKVVELGAPARAEELQEGSRQLAARLVAAEDVGQVVADMLKFMARAIKQLRSDVANFTLTVMNAELSRNCVEFQREFFRSCYPPPQRWASTLGFFKQQLSSPATAEVAAGLPPMAMTLSLEEQRMFAALISGSLDLLRSSTKVAESRWVSLPQEGFYFEKPIISSAASTVQLSALRLMLTATVSMILGSKKLSPAAVNQLLTNLDKSFVDHVSGADRSPEPPTIASITDIVSGAVAEFCANQTPPVTMSATDMAVLRNVIGKMISTDSQQYIAFEDRVVRALRQLVLADPREASKVPNSQKPRILGLVSDALYDMGGKLRLMIDHNWEVMSVFYMEMVSALELVDPETPK